MENSSLNGFKFRSENNKPQYSFNNGEWENFTKALSTFGQGENKYGILTTSLVVTANQDYELAIMVISGATINLSSCSTSGSGSIKQITHNVSNLQIFPFILKNIKQGDMITILSSTQARFNYLMLY